MSRRANGAGTLYRRGGWYYAQIRIGSGMFRKTLKTKDKAEARRRLDALCVGHELDNEERLAALAVRLKPRNNARSFDEAWDYYVHSPENIAQSPLARRNNETIWRGFVRYLHGHDKPRSRLNCKGTHPAVDALDDITERIASEFVEYMKENRSPETANKYVRVLKRVWTINKCDENPWARFKKFKVRPIQRRAFSKKEVEDIIGAAEGELRSLFVIGAYTGLRLSDCQHLTYDSIDGEAGVIKTGKTGKIVRIPIHPKLKAVLGKGKRGYVLKELSKYPEWKISNLVQAHFAKCGFAQPQKVDGYKRSMGDVGFHSFRSTFITWLGEAGVPLPVVREMVGHISEEMTMRYFRTNDAMMKKAIAALS